MDKFCPSIGTKPSGQLHHDTKILVHLSGLCLRAKNLKFRYAKLHTFASPHMPFHYTKGLQKNAISPASNLTYKYQAARICSMATQKYIEIYLVDWNIIPIFVAVLLK
jgi:hypothetical protein